MVKIVFLKIVFYFKIENTIFFSIFKMLLKTILPITDYTAIDRMQRSCSI